VHAATARHLVVLQPSLVIDLQRSEHTRVEGWLLLGGVLPLYRHHLEPGCSTAAANAADVSSCAGHPPGDCAAYRGVEGSGVAAGARAMSEDDATAAGSRANDPAPASTGRDEATVGSPDAPRQRLLVAGRVGWAIVGVAGAVAVVGSVVGRSSLVDAVVKLPALVVVLVVTAGAIALGVLGAFLAVPVTAVAGHAVRSWRETPDVHAPAHGPGEPVSDGAGPG
jgi:hypothetical protein